MEKGCASTADWMRKYCRWASEVAVNWIESKCEWAFKLVHEPVEAVLELYFGSFEVNYDEWFR